MRTNEPDGAGMGADRFGRSGASANALPGMLDALDALYGARDERAIAGQACALARDALEADGAFMFFGEGDSATCLEENAANPILKGAEIARDDLGEGWRLLNGAADGATGALAAIHASTADRGSIRTFAVVHLDVPGRVAALGLYWFNTTVAGPAQEDALRRLGRSVGKALSAVADRRMLTKHVNELSVLYRLTDRLYRAQSLRETYYAALDAIAEALDCRRASILLFDDEGVMRFAGWRGLSDAYRAAVEGHTPWRQGESEAEPILVSDAEAEDNPEWLKAALRSESIRALAFVPIFASGGVIGKFMTYYDTPHAFSEREMDLAVAVSRQVGFSLERDRAARARAEAVRELERSRAMLHLATKAGRLGVWEWDILGDRISWTDSMFAMHGVSPDAFEPTRQGFLKVVHADDRERVRHSIQRALAGSEPFEFEFRTVRSDGTVGWLFATATVVRRGEEPVRVVGATVDVTERMQAEAALRESEARFRLMSEYAPVMIWLSDATGGCLYLNKMLRQFWNVEDQAFESFDWRTSMHPEDAPEIVRQMVEALQERREVTIRGRYLDYAGRYRILSTHARPRFARDGEFLGMIGVNVDITERELSEAALRESEERFRLAVEAAPSGMVMTDSAGRIMLVNADAERLFGYGREELIGRQVEMLVPERFRARHPALRASVLENAAPRRIGEGRELFALRKDGVEVPVEIGLSPIVTPDGAMILASVFDITERKQAEAQRELLIAELNHRMKNMLAVVQSIAHQTFRGEELSAEARKAFDGRLVALASAHELLTRKRWDSASMKQLVQDIFHTLGAKEHRISVSGPEILLQPKQTVAVAMALHELCTNAIKYGALSNDKGMVRLGWSYEDADRKLELVWQEEGGPPVSAPSRRGFGTRLIERGLASDFGASVDLDFRPEGLICRINAQIA